MNKTELTEQLSKKTGMSKAAAKRAVDALFSTAPREGIIASAVAKGDRVQIKGENLSGRVVILGQQLVNDGSAIAIPDVQRIPAAGSTKGSAP